MNDVRFTCASCGQSIQCDAAYGGENIPCPNCAALIRVPNLPEYLVQPESKNPDENPFNTAGTEAHADRVSYSSVPGSAKAAHNPDPPSAPADSSPAPPEPVSRIVLCVCPACHSDLNVHVSESPTAAAELVHRSAEAAALTAPPAPPPSSSHPQSVAEREQQIAAAREKIGLIQNLSAVKPRLSYLLSGGERPNESENQATHPPPPPPAPPPTQSFPE